MCEAIGSRQAYFGTTIGDQAFRAAIGRRLRHAAGGYRIEKIVVLEIFMPASYSLCIEEEYFLVDRRTDGLKPELSNAFMSAAGRRLGKALSNEMLQSQIEIATPPVTTAADALGELLRFRSVLAEEGRGRGLGILAAGTHPFSRPDRQLMTAKRRYRAVIDELGTVGLHNPLCGLHVHVEVPDPDDRIDLMHRTAPFLPLLLALSTSSPFWAGRQTGLLGYRNAANDAMPRSGLPDMFDTVEDYRAYVTALTEAGVIRDETYIWWVIRPSLNYPTLELRITDCCTSAVDAVAVAALYRAIVRHLVRHPALYRDRSVLARALVKENRWRAQRYGLDGDMIDIMTHQAVPARAAIRAMLAGVGEDMAALGHDGEAAHVETILKRGTSAHAQLDIYKASRAAGQLDRVALRDVARWLRLSTEAGDFIDRTDARRAA